MKLKQLISMIAPFALAGVLVSSPTQAAVVDLFEWAVNIDGVVSNPTHPIPAAVDIGLFDDVTGLGSISITITGAGAHTFDAFLDHDIDQAINTFYNETGATVGIAAAGQSWEIDEPGWVDGDIYENFEASALDNGIGTSIYGNTAFPDDVSMAMGWDFALASGEVATIDILLSLSAPSGGFYLAHTDPGSNESIYLSSTLSISQVPIPAAVYLFGSGLLGLIGIARKKKTA